MPLFPDYWWQKDIPRISDASLEPQPQHGFWVEPHHYRFKHPVTGRTQDMVFPPNRDPADMQRIVADQEPRALAELSDPRPHKAVRKASMSRRLAMIEGRETAVKERWY